MIFVLEGLPGTGKTTISKMMENQKNFIRIGEILDKDGNEILPSMTKGLPQNFFFQSDKLKHKKGISYIDKNVVIDRGVFSTIAYNSCFSEKCNRKLKSELKELSKEYLKDTTHIYIKITPELSLSRKKKTPSLSDLWSFKENLKKISRLYDGYFKDNKSTIIIDGSIEISKVYKNILNEIKKISK